MPLRLTAADLVAQARARIEEVAAVDALQLLDNPDIVFVDVRDVRERQAHGFIPQSFHCPRGMVEFWVDPASPYFKDIFGAQKKFLFYCASGWRSALTVQSLHMMGFENAAHIKEGFTGWVAAHGAVAKL